MAARAGEDCWYGFATLDVEPHTARADIEALVRDGLAEADAMLGVDQVGELERVMALYGMRWRDMGHRHRFAQVALLAEAPAWWGDALSIFEADELAGLRAAVVGDSRSVTRGLRAVYEYAMKSIEDSPPPLKGSR